RRAYERALARALARPAPILAGSLAPIVLAVGLTPLTHLEFLPEFHETNFVVHMTGAPGVGFAESLRVGAAVGKRLLAVHGVESVAQVIGRSTLSEDVWGPERSEMMVHLAPEVDSEAVTDAIRERTGDVAGFAFDLKQFLNERIEELIGGTGADIVIRLRGLELPSLEQAAVAVSERVAAVAGVSGLHAPGALAAPGLRIHPRRDDLLLNGVGAAAVERAVRSALGGLPVGRLVEGERQADVVVRVASDAATDPERFARLPVVMSDGRTVLLGAVAAGGRLSLGAIVGFVTVFGITIRNGIVLIAYFQQVERAEASALDHRGLVAAAADRLAPILMTALVTGIALLPLLFLGGHAGGEIEQPMALVIVGGPFTSTWLNLF